MLTNKAITLLLLLLILSVTACSAADSAPDPAATPELLTIEPGQPITVPRGQTAVLPTADLNLTFVDLLFESRCPSKVQCAEAGEARISIRVSQNGAGEETLELNTNPPLKQDVVVFGDFQIQLMALNPYPEEIDQRIPASVYEATFVVTEVAP
jgi:hypothetical protein